MALIQPQSKGWFVDLYDKYDQDWLPDRFSGRDTDPEGMAKYAEDNWGGIGSGLAKVYRGANAVGGGIANALVGSPIRAASTALTGVTGPVSVAAKLGSALRPVGYAARGMDAVNALRSTAQVGGRYSGRELWTGGRFGYWCWPFRCWCC